MWKSDKKSRNKQVMKETGAWDRNETKKEGNNENWNEKKPATSATMYWYYKEPTEIMIITSRFAQRYLTEMSVIFCSSSACKSDRCDRLWTKELLKAVY